MGTKSADTRPYPSSSAKEDLFDAIRGGDEAAFARYYNDSFNRLVFRVQRIVNDTEEARNIAQDTFVKLWRQRERIDPRQSPDGFISTIATNAALDFLKGRRVRARHRDESLYLNDDRDASPDAAMQAMETERRIEEAIRRMPAQRRRVFELSRKEGLSYNQIAGRLNISYHTVKEHIQAALKDLHAIVASLIPFILFG
jgi:RNA polymerase sigma-70 factor (ECF subfamily)